MQLIVIFCNSDANLQIKDLIAKKKLWKKVVLEKQFGRINAEST